jgi:hypothetical protein
VLKSVTHVNMGFIWIDPCTCSPTKFIVAKSVGVLLFKDNTSSTFYVIAALSDLFMQND